MGVSREYMFHTRELDARATIIKFGYLYSLNTRHGFNIPPNTRALVFNGNPTRSSTFMWCAVSGSRK